MYMEHFNFRHPYRLTSYSTIVVECCIGRTMHPAVFKEPTTLRYWLGLSYCHSAIRATGARFLG